jgi:branched-chain amino acid transport system permease protein
MIEQLRSMPRRAAAVASIVAVLLVFVAVRFGSPPLVAILVGFAALALVVLLPLRPTLRALTFCALTAAFGLALAGGKMGNVLFIGLTILLVAVVRRDDFAVWIKASIGALILLVAIPAAGLANTFLLELGIQIGIYAAMALGLNVVVGMAGLLDLGYAAFFAIGAYTWGIFGSPQAAQFMHGTFPLPGSFMFLFMFVAIIATAVTGILIGLPALRLRGDYLAIVTLGLGETIRILANNLDHPINITNGPQGITPIGRPDIGWFRSAASVLGIHLDARTDYQLFFYFLVLVVIAVVVAVNVNLGKSRFGRAWVAIREDEIAAKSMGIPMVRTKLQAFATGAAFSGAMGVIFAAQRTFVSPETFTMLASTTILGMVVLGGMGSIEGAVLGAASLTILNLDVLKSFSEYLNGLRQSGATFLGYHFADLPSQLDPAKYERLVFGLVLIAMMIYRPEGLLPEKRRAEERKETKGDSE